MGSMLVQQVTLPPCSSRCPSLILSSGYCLYGVSVHFILMSVQVSSRFSGSMLPPKNMLLGRYTNWSKV